MNNERYNQIIDEAYKNYRLERNFQINQGVDILSQEEFINKCKSDPEFSQKWNLQIKETYDLIPHTEDFGDVTITKPIRRNKLIVAYKNEIIEVYE